MESQRETSVCCQPKSPEGRKKRIPQTGHSWSQKAPPPPISSIARIKSTHGSTRLCIISTQKQTLGLTIGASEPVLTLSPGNHGKAAQRGKSLRICLLPKGRVGWHSFTSCPTRDRLPYEAIIHPINGSVAWSSLPRSERIVWGGAAGSSGPAGPLALWSFTPASEEAEGKVISYPSSHSQPQTTTSTEERCNLFNEIRHSIHILQYTSVT